MEREPEYHLGSEPVTVLASALRDASHLGWALLSDPQTTTVEGSRVIYRTSPETGRTSPVAVLAAGASFDRRMRRSIEATLKANRSNGNVRKVDVVNRVQLAERLGCVPDTIDNYRKIPTFPKPFAPRLWDLREVQRWIRERDRYLSPARRAGKSS